MRLATVLTPMSDQNLKLAAQCGVTDVVSRYPGPSLQELVQEKERVESFGMRVSVIEGFLPMDRIKLGIDDGSELQAMINLVRHMGEADVPVLCYNFMAGTDWVRTCLNVPERGGARVTGFDVEKIDRAVLLGHDSSTYHDAPSEEMVTAEQLWRNLHRMLDELVPVAEEAGVALAMHPDDPPLQELFGRPRIMNSVENFERFVNLVPSRVNGICFCQGTFAEMGVDISRTIRRLGPHIHFVHFRDVRGSAESFTECFHDNGPTDMADAMRGYREIDFDGPMRPDHVPQLAGEEDRDPGYSMLGRLFAYGYIRGLMQATDEGFDRMQ